MTYGPITREQHNRTALIAFITYNLYGRPRMLDTTGFDHAPDSVDEFSRLFGMDTDAWTALTDADVRAWAWGIGEAV